MKSILMVSLLTLAAIGACSANDGQSGGGLTGGSGGSAANGGTGATGGALTDASTDSGGTGGGIQIDGAIPDVFEASADSSCAADSVDAEPVPVNLYLMLDRSGSMAGTKWSKTTAGLIGFVQSAAAADLRVALNYFPSITGDDCEPLSYSTPHVPLGTLSASPAPADTHEQALVNSLSTTGTTGVTPMHPAFVGLLGYCTALAKTNPTEKVIAVLVTDGSPTSCANSGGSTDIIGKIAALAASGYADTPPIITFTIGLEGSKEAELKQIAQAGGGEAFFIGSGNLEQELTQKLQQISGGSIACDYLVPEGSGGAPTDLDKVNVNFVPGTGSTQPLVKVDSAAECVPNAWYYDNPADPKRIILCPGTCSAAQGDPNAKIEILVGCQTRIPS